MVSQSQRLVRIVRTCGDIIVHDESWLFVLGQVSPSSPGPSSISAIPRNASAALSGSHGRVRRSPGI